MRIEFAVSLEIGERTGGKDMTKRIPTGTSQPTVRLDNDVSDSCRSSFQLSQLRIHSPVQPVRERRQPFNNLVVVISDQR